MYAKARRSSCTHHVRVEKLQFVGLNVSVVIVKRVDRGGECDAGGQQSGALACEWCRALGDLTCMGDYLLRTLGPASK